MQHRSSFLEAGRGTGTELGTIATRLCAATTRLDTIATILRITTAMLASITAILGTRFTELRTMTTMLRIVASILGIATTCFVQSMEISTRNCVQVLYRMVVAVLELALIDGV